MPNDEPIDRLFAPTLADLRISAAEKKALRPELAAFRLSPQQRQHARHLLFQMARDRAIDPHTKQLVEWLEDAVKLLENSNEDEAEGRPTPPSTAWFSPGAACLNELAGQLRAAKSTLDICVFTITDDRISGPILDAHRRGVKVRVVTDNDKANDLGSDIARLEEAGIAVVVDRTEFHMHHKFAIFDRERLLNGSFNWTRGAVESNEENFVVTHEAALVRAFEAQFNTLWERLSS